jgi:hypothetical protein
MFTSLSIENFKGFKRLELDSLQRVNLIVGPNNSGKTALLEALFLLIGEANLLNVGRISGFRGVGRAQGDPNEVADWFWLHIFNRFQIDQAVMIGGTRSDGSHRQIRLHLARRASTPVVFDEQTTSNGQSATRGLSSYTLEIEFTSSAGEGRTARMIIDQQGSRQEPPPAEPVVPGYFQSSRGGSLEDDARIFSMLEVEREPTDVIDVLRILEPRLARVRTVAGAGGTLIYGDIGIGRMLPFALMGEGLVRLTSHLVRIATAPHGVFLVDEIEIGLHHSVLEKVWAAIAEAARRFDVQVFATTHSWECIQAAHRAFQESGTYDLGLFRLDRVEEDTRAVTFDAEMLGTAVEMNLEVR